MKNIGRYLGSLVLLSCATLAAAAEQTVVDPDSVPRVVGGSSTVGGAQNMLVIPYGLPKIPENTVVGKKTAWGDPDFSGVYDHNARIFQNPYPSRGIGPGISAPPTAMTLFHTMVTDRLGSRADYTTPLLRPWAADLVKRLGDAETASMPYFERCLSDDGMLLSWSLGNRGLNILQTPERIYMSFGHDVVRIVHLNAQHPGDLQSTVNGHSVGRWEGDTLVIDTIGFNGTIESDRYGTPTSDEMHILERLHRRYGDQILEVEFWIDDPVVFTQPWTSETTYWRAERLGKERICREGQMFPSPY